MAIGALDISIAGDADGMVVHVVGEIDADTAWRFREAVLGAYLADGRDVVLDLAGVGFVDSSGISALVALHRRLQAENARLAVRSPRPGVTKVLQLTGVLDLLGPPSEVAGSPPLV